MAWQHQIAWIVALPFILNLVFNFAFTTLQFKLKNNLLAAADVFAGFNNFDLGNCCNLSLHQLGSLNPNPVFAVGKLCYNIAINNHIIK